MTSAGNQCREGATGEKGYFLSRLGRDLIEALAVACVPRRTHDGHTGGRGLEGGNGNCQQAGGQRQRIGLCQTASFSRGRRTVRVGLAV